MEDETITTIKLGADITKNLELDKAITIDGQGKQLTGTINITGNGVNIKNLKVNDKVTVSGENAVLDTITMADAHSTQQNGTSQPHNHMVDVTGKGITIKNSTFTGTDDTTSNGVFRDVIFIENAASGNATIEGNTFENLKNVYNGVDIGGNFKVGSDFVFKDNKFDPEILHNALSFYEFEEGAEVNIENCELTGMRISNWNNATATINFKGGKAVFTEDQIAEAGEWGFLLFQQDKESDKFNTLTINIDGFKNPKGNQYTAEGTGAELFCSYYNSTDKENHKVSEDNKAQINYNS